MCKVILTISVRGFDSVIYDDRADIEFMTDHLIDKHGYRYINFLAGPYGQPQSMARLDGYADSLKKHGIPVEYGRIFYGDFWYDAAASCIDAFEKSGLPFPEAIVCANDHMALAVINELNKRGKTVPGDVAVTGYDCDCSGIVQKHAVTSIRVNTIRLGRVAAKIMLAKINGTDVGEPPKQEVPSMLVTASCGCEHSTRNICVNLEHCGDGGADENGMFSVNSRMLDDIIDSHNIKEFLHKVDSYSCLIKNFSHLSIMLSDDWMKQYGANEVNPFDERICWIYTHLPDDKADESVDTHRFIRRDEIPPFIENSRKASAYFFLPVHSNRFCFGYYVLSYGSLINVFDMNFAWWARYVGNALESLRRYINQINLNEENSLLSSNIIKTQEEVILAFAEITESKSGQTGKHIKRVSEYTRILAEGMGMPDKEADMLRIASMLHDVGKLLIPSEILEKPGKLTAEEFDIIKTHVTTGEQLLHNAPGEIMAVARTVALHHHERWNGKGYLGIRGSAIDLYSRIVAVADVYDALSSKRSYKDSWEKSRVYEHIVSERGEHFDPDVVDVFMQRYNEISLVQTMYPD